jgi:aminopeptidase N
MKASRLLSLSFLALLPALASAQQAPPTRADTLRGTITPERAWWDVVHYDLSLRVSPADSSISGSNVIHYAVVGPQREMQIDLQQPMQVDSVVQGGARLEHRREGNALFVRMPSGEPQGSRGSVTVHYHGRPHAAVMPPWDGGLVWARGPSGEPWVGTAVQGIGASLWWPNKDHQADEPDSMRIRVTVPQGLTGVSNGRFEGTEPLGDGTTFTWRVANPINNYGVSIYVGDYVHFGDSFEGEAGALDLDYWVLEPHLEEARRQFEQVKPTLACFESWFGPYPFYEDGFKMVESPYLGMEHQSAIAYGNQFRNGYLGQDISGTGLGLSWDYIIVHEAAHEWWGNNVTTEDIADMWVHEGFGTYSEGLFVECQQGKEAGARYILGQRASIANDEPLIGTYGVQRKGSDDMYMKGANVLHTIRQVVDDDALWRSILRGLNETFRHQTVTSAEVEGYIGERAARDLSPVFDQYLRRAALPVLEYAVQGGTLSYRWAADVEGFDLPVRVTLGPDRFGWIEPEVGRWKSEAVDLPSASAFQVDPNFFVEVRQGQPGS